ncbi:hypothetical protein ACFPJ1_33685 [Kribbella qitaiheensis]|uniref:hypothetical protein n=1 Tax=Kribbella qitaiheensis TaxID=1544730 RepID=UPI003617AE4A
MPDQERITRSELSAFIKSISRPRRLPILPRRIWSDDDWERIQLGYSAQDMDEKWNVFAEGDVVFLHRSWTGDGVYEATFASVDGGGRQITLAVTQRMRFSAIRRLLSMRFRGDDEWHCLLLELVLSAIVLGEPAHELRTKLLELIRERIRESEIPAGAVLHSILGTRSDS